MTHLKCIKILLPRYVGTPMHDRILKLSRSKPWSGLVTSCCSQRNAFGDLHAVGWAGGPLALVKAIRVAVWVYSVQLTSCLTGLDLAEQVSLLLIKPKPSS